jgi:hypothetical protein
MGSLLAFLPDLARGEAFRPVELGGLGVADIATWLPYLVARADPGLAAMLHSATGGNPLLVRLVAAEVAASPSSLDALLAQRPQLRRLVASRVDAPPPQVREAVRAASVLGERIVPAVLTAMTGADDITGALEVARAGGILRDSAFEHGLVRDAVYADLEPSRRRELHHAAAVALEADASAPPGVIAWHWQRAGEPARCLPWAQQADDVARTALAYADASRFAELVVSCARETGADLTEPLLRLAEAQALDGFADRSVRTCMDAASAAESTGRADLLAAAALVVQGVGNADLHRLIGSLCDRALAALPEGEHALRARLLAQRAVFMAETDAGPRAEELAAEALTEAERSADSNALLEAMAARHLTITIPGTVVERLELGTRAVQLGAVAKRPMAALWGHLWRLDAAAQLGIGDDVDRELAELDRIARERGSVLARWHYLRYLAARHGRRCWATSSRRGTRTVKPMRWQCAWARSRCGGWRWPSSPNSRSSAVIRVKCRQSGSS